MRPPLLTLEPDRLQKTLLPLGTGWLLAACMEARGKQDLWMRQKPEVLAALREQAMVQSVESSNRIEGVTVSEARLRPLVLEASRPRDRSEEELAGYRRALDWIFTRKHQLVVGPEVVLHLHALAQRGSGDAGRWKRLDNEIVEIRATGVRQTRFRPTSARETAPAMASLCRNYREACEIPSLPPLLVVATFVFDFLCIHPFRDGNGRVSRLLTTLLLEQQGFSVGRYVSMERLIEETKESYYQVLQDCSRGWHEGHNEILPWWTFFLSTLNGAYREFAERVEATRAGPTKGSLVRREVLAQVGPFSLAEITAHLPSVSTQLVKSVLSQLKREGTLRLVGHGRGALWEVLRPKR